MNPKTTHASGGPHRHGAAGGTAGPIRRLDARRRTGLRNGSDTIFSVPTTQAQTVLAQDMATPTAALQVDTLLPGCPLASTCGFATGMRGLIFDMTGVGAGYDLFTVTSVNTDQVGHGGSNPSVSKTYDATVSRVVEAKQAVYYLDAANDQLRHYDGYESDVVLVDGVVALKFTYYANPDPNSAPQPATGLSNCVFAAGDPPAPRSS